MVKTAHKIPKTPKRKRASFSPVVEEEAEVKNAAVTDDTPAFQAPVEQKATESPETTSEKEESPESQPAMVVEEVPAKHEDEQEESAEKTSSEEETSTTKESSSEEKPADQAPTVAHFAPVEEATDPEYTKIASASRTSIVILILVAIISFAIGMGSTYAAFQLFGGNGRIITLKSSPSPEVTPSPAPTEKPIDRNSISIEVLNGSGKAGAAKKAADILEGLGYKIEGTGNADKSSYEESVLEVKDSVGEEIITLLRQDLEKNYTLASESGKLSDDAKASVRFIVGKK